MGQGPAAAAAARFRTAQDSCAPWFLFCVLDVGLDELAVVRAGHRRAGPASAARAHAERQPRIGRHPIGQRVAAQRLGQLAGSRLPLRFARTGPSRRIVDTVVTDRRPGLSGA